MFANPFSSDGRIRRTEFGISFIIYAIIATFINLIIAENKDAGFLGLALIPAIWFLLAQGAKRCHDVGNSGWWQLIPLYAFWLLFQEGDAGSNEYGDNPKGNQQTTKNTYNSSNSAQPQTNNPSGGYNQGHYDGGHNNHGNTNYQSTPTYNSAKSSGEYKSGELYK
jgi:uncharacterized membrane protein YhaH (DUF805 family)